MEGISIIIPVYNKLEITLRCIEHIRKMNRKGVAEIIIVDNGSTDATPVMLSKQSDIAYIRSLENLGIAKAFNCAAENAKGDIFCFMHNDVFVHEQEWAARLAAFIRTTTDAGVVGLYGAKMLRRDGSFRGRTIIHAIKDAPAIRGSFEKVAVVDGLLLAMRQQVFMDIGRFQEAYTMHYYDKDISMRAWDRGYSNYVLNMTFEHQSAATRKQISGEAMIRDKAREQFLEQWGHHLPVDMSTFSEKLKHVFRMAPR
jgi:GT2 family glycosyltransferase